MKNAIFAVILACIFCSCVNKTANLTQSKSVKFLIISPLARISDSGFIHSLKNSVIAQIYLAGSGIFEIKIKEQICINQVCYSKENFNQKFFAKSYYDDILKDILTSKPLFSAKTTPNDCGGFTQKMQDFTYEVCKNKTSFKNAKTKIEFMQL